VFILKVCIIGLDALDHDIVESLDLKNLKQIEYGKVDLLLKKNEEAITPILWCNFITGETPDVHGIKSFLKWENPLIEKIVSSIPYSVIGGMRRNQLASVLRKLGFKKRGISSMRQDIKCNTLFDYVNDSIAISIPSFNEDEVNEVLRRMLVEAPAFRVKSLAWKAFQNRKQRLFNALNKEWSLLMTHFYILDVIQHLYFYDTKYIQSVYKKIDSMIKEIKEKVSNDLLFLIISDHGQKRGIHTNYGFYSCNQKLNLIFPKITDFVDIICKKLGVPSKTEIDKIKERLQSLGYIS